MVGHIVRLLWKPRSAVTTCRQLRTLRLGFGSMRSSRELKGTWTTCEEDDRVRAVHQELIRGSVIATFLQSSICVPWWGRRRRRWFLIYYHHRNCGLKTKQLFYKASNTKTDASSFQASLMIFYDCYDPLVWINQARWNRICRSKHLYSVFGGAAMD